MSEPAPPPPPPPPGPPASAPTPPGAEPGADAGWQRLDPLMLLAQPVVEVVRFLPAVIALLIGGTVSGGAGWQFFGILVPVALGVLRYLTTSYRITRGRVELRRGLLSRNVLSTPIDRVRTVDLTASPIHRVLGLVTLRIGTGTGGAGDDEGKLDLDGLRADRARLLRHDLLRESADAAPGPQAHPGGSDVAPGHPSPPALDDDGEVVVAFSPRWLRFAPFTSSGTIVAAGLLGIGGQLLGEIEVDIGPNTFDRLDLGVPWPVLVLGAVVAFLAVGAVLSLAGYLVVNGGFRLRRLPRAWRITRGLLTTRDTTLELERVAGVRFEEPWGVRLARGARVSAIVTGLGGEASSAMLVPPAPRATAARAVGAVLDDDDVLGTPLTGHGPAAGRRRLVRALVVPVLLAAALVMLVVEGFPAWLLLAAPVLLVGGLLLGRDRARALGHALTPRHLLARSGSALRRLDALDRDHVIGWNLHSTWFQRRAGLTTLVATTAGGPQAVRVLDVPEDAAVTLAAQTLPETVRQFTA